MSEHSYDQKIKNRLTLTINQNQYIAARYSNIINEKYPCDSTKNKQNKKKVWLADQLAFIQLSHSPALAPYEFAEDSFTSFRSILVES